MALRRISLTVHLKKDDMRLTTNQINMFNAFGYLAFPGLFADDIEKVTNEFESMWSDVDHDETKRSIKIPFIDENQYLSALLDDHRIEGTIGCLLGENFNYTASDGNLYAGETDWHSDGYFRHPGYTSIKIAFYLDGVTKDNGCLRVIPGSHQSGDAFADGLQSVLDARTMDKQSMTQSTGELAQNAWGMPSVQVPCVPLESNPGDMLLFDHRLKHSSFGGGGRRRMFTMNFEHRYMGRDQVMLRDEFAINLRFGVKQPYGDVMLQTATPSRMVHLEQRLANVHYMEALLQE